MAETFKLSTGDYPLGFRSLAAELPDCPWIYTGGLENHPELIDAIASDRPLWGNSGPVLRRIRNPLEVASILAAAGLPHPAVRSSPDGLPVDGSWLLKPFASAGGRGIVAWLPGSKKPAEPSFWQERIEGENLSAVFAAGPGPAMLLGVTRQLLGRKGRPFAYRGSIGPWPISAELEAQISRLGTILADAVGVRGLFGVDLVVRGEIPYPIEVNPRYSASIEVLELAIGRPFLLDHRRAFDSASPRTVADHHEEPRNCTEPSVRRFPGIGRPRPAPRQGIEKESHTTTRFVAKSILFGDHPAVFPEIGFDHPGGNPWKTPRIADIPFPGERFRPGEPILTVFSRGSTIESVSTRLERRLSAWAARIAGDNPAIGG